MRNQNCILGGSFHESKVGYIPVISGISRVNPPITGIYIYIQPISDSWEEPTSTNYNPIRSLELPPPSLYWTSGDRNAAMLHLCFTIIKTYVWGHVGDTINLANINRSLFSDDRTLFSLIIIMFSKGNHPQMTQHFRLVNHYNLPIYICV